MNNATSCRKCGDVVEPDGRCDAVTCACGTIALIGDTRYVRVVDVEARRKASIVRREAQARAVEATRVVVYLLDTDVPPDEANIEVRADGPVQVILSDDEGVWPCEVEVNEMNAMMREGWVRWLQGDAALDALDDAGGASCAP